MDALGFVSVQHQGNVVVLMFLPGTLPDCDIRLVISCPFTVLDEALLKLTEEFVVIRMPVALGESDIISHKVNFAVAAAHVGHDLIDLLQYRFFASELSVFVGHDGVSLVLVFVGDSFVSHVAVFLGYCSSLVTGSSVSLSVGMSPPVMSKALTGGLI